MCLIKSYIASVLKTVNKHWTVSPKQVDKVTWNKSGPEPGLKQAVMSRLPLLLHKRSALHVATSSKLISAVLNLSLFLQSNVGNYLGQ